MVLDLLGSERVRGLRYRDLADAGCTQAQAACAAWLALYPPQPPLPAPAPTWRTAIGWLLAPVLALGRACTAREAPGSEPGEPGEPATRGRKRSPQKEAGSPAKQAKASQADN